MIRLRRGQAGSVVMLAPAAVLILVVLGAITVDSAVVFLAQRQLANRAAGLANDIAGLSAADEVLYRRGEVALRQEEADRLVALAFEETAPPAGFDEVAAVAEVDGRAVVVRVEGRVRRIFAPAIPGVQRTARVTASSRAIAAEP